MLIVTTETVPGREIAAVMGLVDGSTIQTRHVGSHIVAGLMTLIGGEVKGYVTAMNSARDQAMDRMIAKAEAMGADAIVCTRFSTSQIMSGGAEIFTYGTAVKLR